MEDIAKQDAGDINKKFGETAKRITPATTFPASSGKRITITFSEEPEKPSITTYLKATDELPVWYWNVEKSFFKTIDEQNRKAQNFIDEDAKLSIRWESLREQLSEYQKEPKIRKKEIKDLKKEVTAVEKERKNVSKQMKKEADNFAAYLKDYNKEIQGEYKVRIQNVTEEIDYSFHQK
jgi:regulator of replication initiation timing